MKKSTRLAKRNSRRQTPLVVRWLRFGFKVLNVLAPQIGARRAYRLWFTSPRYPEPVRETRWREKAENILLPYKQGQLAVYRWGHGPVIVLVHGWSGRGTQLGAFVKPLVESGHSVVAFDAPGHGRSSGKATNVFEVCDALNTVIEQTGPAKAIVAHSFGTMVTTLALRQGLQVGKVVCISAPNSLLYLIEKFTQSLAINQKTQMLLKDMLEQQFGDDIWEKVSSDRNIANSAVPALIVHDEDDYDVPIQCSEQLAKAWSGSRLWRTQGLGHRRILRNRAVVDMVTKFIVDDELPADS